MAEDLDRRLQELERQLAEQEQFVRRMVVRGTPSQAAEDRLRQLQRQISALKDERNAR
jgi:uncharacterized coiled-coil protein SlyX